MIEIVIPESIKVGCFDYSIKLASGQVDQRIRADGRRGIVDFTERTIYIVPNMNQQDIMNCFLHEIVHCIDTAYFNQELSENNVALIANGFHEALKSLGIRFVLKEA